MKNIQDLLKRKAAKVERSDKGELDEKTIVRVFIEAAKSEIKNLSDDDFREIKMTGQTLFIKTAHPVVSSELFLRRERILEKTNEIARKKVVVAIAIN